MKTRSASELPPLRDDGFWPDGMIVSQRTADWLGWEANDPQQPWPAFAIYILNDMPDGRAALGTRTPRGFEIAGTIQFVGFRNLHDST